MRKSFFTPLSPWAIEIIKRGAVEFKVYDEWYDGYAYKVLFPNGYAASIVKFTGSYGNRDNLWEVAVMKDGEIRYDTEITDDVLGYLTEADVMDTCREIAAFDEDGRIVY